MATVTFDTLKFANKLKSAGVPDKQAEAEAEAIAEVIQVNFKDLVTKEDLRHELKELEMRFDAKLDRLEAKLMGEIARLENTLAGELIQLEGKLMGEITQSDAKLMAEITQVRGEITYGLAQVRGEISLLKWTLGALLAGVVSLVLKAFFI